MKDSHWRRVLLIFFWLWRTVAGLAIVNHTTSDQLVVVTDPLDGFHDNRLDASSADHPASINNNRTNKLRVDRKNDEILDDLCRRSHGNLVFYQHQPTQHHLDQGQDVNLLPMIQIIHESFDASFGLVPFVNYKVKLSYHQPHEQTVEQSIMVMQVNLGQVTTTPETTSMTSPCQSSFNYGQSSQLIHLLMPENNGVLLTNISWVIKSVPENPTNLTIRIFKYWIDSRNIDMLSSVNYTVLPGCYLKLLPSNVMTRTMTVSSWQIPPQLLGGGTPVSLGASGLTCSFLVHIPKGSNAEVTLRKLKLLRMANNCHKDSQLQLMSSTNISASSWSSSMWFNKAAMMGDSDPSWSIGRTFCGKIQDYGKNQRTWRTFHPWLLIRYRQQHLDNRHQFFALKINLYGPCSNPLLTDRRQTIEISTADFLGSECHFRIHVPYGDRIHLMVQWMTAASEEEQVKKTKNKKETATNFNASENEEENQLLLLQSGKCPVAVQVDDARTGHRTKCLHPEKPKASFESAANIIKFQAIVLFPEGGKNDVTTSSSDPLFNAVDPSSPLFLVIDYFSESERQSTTSSCEGQGYLLADETTCIWLQREAMSWHEAEADCNQQLGGHLVAITSDEIQQAVEAVIINSAHYESTDSYWIGGSDQKQETVYEWTNGKPFNYAKWFTGWPAHQLYNAQPSDDGISNQDCIEIRQHFGQPPSAQQQQLQAINGDGSFFWNDRDCSVTNPFVCQKPAILKEKDQVQSAETRTINGVDQDDLSLTTSSSTGSSTTCNRTETLDRWRTSTVVQSPSFPRPYPNAASCTVLLSAPVGFHLVLNFNYFDLEEEEDCNYDAVDLQSLDVLSISDDEQRDEPSTATVASTWRRCGNWNSRLKLLRWKSTTHLAQIRFTSDGSYSGNGFQLVATIERGDFHCPNSSGGSLQQQHHGRCYVIAPYPEVDWFQAHQLCKSLQSELVLPDSSSEEVRFLLDQIDILNEQQQQLNNTATTGFYWIGQTSRFQLSIPVNSADEIQQHQCPSLRPTSSLGYNNRTLNHLEPCHSKGGYICEKLLKSHHGLARNSSIESREGEVKSPNHPLPYGEGSHFRLHIKVAAVKNGSATPVAAERLLVRFKQVDIEFQESCLYDYVGLQSTDNGPMHKICGHYTDSNLDRLDFISDTAEVWLTFHSDWSVSGAGFHAVWSTIPLAGCPESIVREPASGHLSSPNFPNYYLPNLNCTHHLIAPEGQRVWIQFDVLEIGLKQNELCRDEYVRLQLWSGSGEEETTMLLCGSYGAGNSSGHQPSTRQQWMSDGNRLSVQLVSVNGKQGRGFHASYRFVAVPTLMKDEPLYLDGNHMMMPLTPLNYPHRPPTQLRHRMTFQTRHGSYIRFQGASWLTPCPSGVVHSSTPEASIIVILADHYNQDMTPIELCATANRRKQDVDGMSFLYESIFHSLTVEWINIDANWSSSYGAIGAFTDERYAAKVSALPEDWPVAPCHTNPCQPNNGVCVTTTTALDNKSSSHCQCHGNWRGLFCSLTLCQLTPPASYCRHGSCVLDGNQTERCQCDAGFTGPLCDSALSACDLEPCGDRGKCVPMPPPSSPDSFICQCHPWWQGPRCESRWLHLPYKPLSQRMLEEPFWLGLMTIAVVLVVIGLVWCAKRHFAEKFDRFVSEELERGKLVEPAAAAMLDWSHRGHRFSTSHHRLSMEAASSSRPVSPSTATGLNVPESTSGQRHLLGWPGFIRKPSLLSITSLISPSHSQSSVLTSHPAAGNHNGATSRRSAVGSRRAAAQRGCRTFSLDDLFRLPKRSPSPNKRGSDNDVVAHQRREIERQQILQRLIASQIPSHRQAADLANKTNTREASSSLMMAQLGVGQDQHQQQIMNETDLQESAAIAAQIQLQLDLKAEKKVTFARMMEMVKAEMSSSEAETSAGDEEHMKSMAMAAATASDHQHRNMVAGTGKRKQQRSNWNSARRFWRSSHHSNSSTQGSASDQEMPDIGSSISFAEPAAQQSASSIKLSSRQSNTSNSNRHLRLPSRTVSSSGGRQKASSTESLLNMIRSFSSSGATASGSNVHRTPSTPSSPQMGSDYEASSSFPTPLSTPCSPGGSLEIIPSSVASAGGSNNASGTVDSNSIQVVVVDASSSHRNSGRLSVGGSNSASGGGLMSNTPHITLEIPTANYGQFLSPIHEVPTPLPSPAHTPVPSLRRPSGQRPTSISPAEPSTRLERKRWQLQHQPDVIYRSEDPELAPSILVDSSATATVTGGQDRPSISIVVPSIEIRIESESPPPSSSSASNSPLPSPGAYRSRPPPLHIINSNFARFHRHQDAIADEGFSSAAVAPPSLPAVTVGVPVVCVSEASPEREFDAPESEEIHRDEMATWHPSHRRIVDWEHVTLGSPPLRRLNPAVDSHVEDERTNEATGIGSGSVGSIRRGFSSKETLDKSNSLDLPHPPPMITITASYSEVESDSDAGMLGRGMGMGMGQKMSYLSPFSCYGSGRPPHHEMACTSSESNLSSSSGYSSGPSPSCSSKTLCILEEDCMTALHEQHIRMNTNSRRRENNRQQRLLHRSILSPSLESSSPPADSPPGRSSSLLPARMSLFYNADRPLGAITLPSDSEMTDDPMAESASGDAEPIESTCTTGDDEGIDTFPVSAVTMESKSVAISSVDRQVMVVDDDDHKFGELSKLNYLKSINNSDNSSGGHHQVYKSASLDSKLVGQRRTNLKGDSLDTKLLSLQQTGASLSTSLAATPTTVVFQSNQHLQLPDASSSPWSSCCDNNPPLSLSATTAAAAAAILNNSTDDSKLRISSCSSPVSSSRSESPLSSDAKLSGHRFSSQFYGMSIRSDIPYTDSDGLYDYPSSETILPASTSLPRRQARKCDRRRERKTSLLLNSSHHRTSESNSLNG